jgi:NAD(P)-dependent dehydrogenase (short-subunit alcohol dehydrogenase family)
MSADSLVWLVTGCSSGLGRELALAILGRGDKVIATARHVSDLDYIDQVKGSKDQVHKLVLDVSEPFDQLRKMIDAAVTLFGTIDVLVNNAGFLHCAVWEEIRYVPRTGLRAKMKSMLIHIRCFTVMRRPCDSSIRTSSER